MDQGGPERITQESIFPVLGQFSRITISMICHSPECSDFVLTVYFNITHWKIYAMRSATAEASTVAEVGVIEAM